MGALKTPPAPRMNKKVIEDILRKYPLYKQALKFRLYPSVTMDYETERVDGGEKEYASSTEKYGILRAEYSQLVEQVEMILSVLSEDEINLIQQTYFRIDKLPIEIVYEQLHMSRRSYFRAKQQVLDKIVWHFFGTF